MRGFMNTILAALDVLGILGPRDGVIALYHSERGVIGVYFWDNYIFVHDELCGTISL